jgi:hypothetical protein
MPRNAARLITTTVLFFSVLILHAQRVSIALQDGTGNTIATAKSPTKSGMATLDTAREYQPGDRIMVQGPAWMALHVSDAIGECSVYLSPAAHSIIRFEIPYGKGEQRTGSAYPSDAFTGTSHRITATPLTKRDRLTRRNLALNPCDMRVQTPTVFPHASTNSVSRNAYNFDARNAIDGVTKNGHHGEWPYQSWGPLVQVDIWWQLDFGREVTVDSLRVMLRTDFPHDSYWKSAVVEFSDGSALPLELTSSSDFQDFRFPPKRVSSLRLDHLVSAEDRWSGLIELEAWGMDRH